MGMGLFLSRVLTKTSPGAVRFVLHLGAMLQILKPRILVIDDDPSIGVLMTRVFEDTGRYSIDVETDAMRAVAKARGYRPDLLLVDITMPGRSGLEIAAILRQEPELRDRPIVFYTGIVTQNQRGALVEGEAPIEFLSKGLPTTEVVATVDRLLGGRKAAPEGAGS